MIEFRFAQPFAREALELLSARKRGAGDTYLIDDDHVFRHALDLCREKPSVIFREAAVILLELFDLPNVACWRASGPLAVAILSAWRPQYAPVFEREMIHLENLLTSRGLPNDQQEIGSAYAEIASFRESHPLAAMHLQSAYVRRAGKKIVHEREITPACDGTGSPATRPTDALSGTTSRTRRGSTRRQRAGTSTRRDCRCVISSSSCQWCRAPAPLRTTKTSRVR